ncbi:hypothetical protein LSH36_11g13072 [Paralvinella palmiformis]|uniref:Guanylate cyclase domain-containing protein n=1 Tax=Paralvinella palmiformis TaxID=53620 RepID=A0AAD9NJD9_9ANNE|nr:hypothetical protein LSH36_11g13072 [Paralvinella palmiformis]
MHPITNEIDSCVEEGDIDEVNDIRSKNWFRILVRGNVNTKLGRLIQTIKMIVSVTVPFVLFIIIIGSMIVIRMKKKEERTEARKALDFSIDLTHVVHALQKERDTSVVYAARNDNIIQTLSRQYAITDKVISGFSRVRGWKIMTSHYMFLSSADSLESHLKNHRLRVSKNRTPRGELQFYGEVIDALMNWFPKSLPTASVGSVWKMFVSLNEVIKCKNMFSLERAFGSLYFINGGFTAVDDYFDYERVQDIAINSLITSTEYSKVAKTVFTEKISGTSKMAFSVRIMRNQITSDPFGKVNNLQPSIDKFQWWYNNVTLHIDQLLDMRQKICTAILKTLDTNEDIDETFLICISFLFGVMVSSYPVVVMFLYSVTTGLHRYIILMGNRTKIMRKEQAGVDNLLYAIIPKSIAAQLKKSKNIVAECYEEATVFFSDIVDYTGICSKSRTIEIVYMLDDIYSCFDEVIRSHDVYKVTTIGDSYMMVSGIPERNGRRHATEMCSLALDIAERVSRLVIPHMLDRKLELRIGIHTGPVTAGILVGHRPRYHLFGNTVKIASQMESTGLRNRIQISDTTRKYLEEEGGFVCEEKEEQVDGMTTHWLIGKNDIDIERLQSDSVDQFNHNEKI